MPACPCPCPCACLRSACLLCSLRTFERKALAFFCKKNHENELGHGTPTSTRAYELSTSDVYQSAPLALRWQPPHNAQSGLGARRAREWERSRDAPLVLAVRECGETLRARGLYNSKYKTRTACAPPSGAEMGERQSHRGEPASTNHRSDLSRFASARRHRRGGATA